MLLPTRFPITTAEKVEIEYHLDWMLRHFGAEPVYKAETLTSRSPEIRKFASPAGIDCDAALDWLADYLPFDNSGCELLIMGEDEYCPDDPDIIKITPHEAADIEELVAHIACHLSGRYLRRLPATELERTIPLRLKDFVPVYFGLGVFCANTSLKLSQYSVGESHYHQYRKSRAVEARSFGAALAYLAWERNDRHVSWARSLRPDARVPFRQTLRYLRKTNDSLFNTRIATAVFANENDVQLISLLEQATPSVQFAILQQLFFNTLEVSPRTTSQRLGPLLPQLPMLLRSSDKDICKMACHLAGHVDRLDDPAITALKELMADRDPEVRMAALATISLVAAPEQLNPWELRSFLHDSDMRLVNAAALGLVQRGQQAEELSPDLLTAIRRLAGSDLNDLLVHVCGALTIICGGDPDQQLQSYFNKDPDLLEEALQAVQTWREVAHPEIFGEDQDLPG